MFHLQSWKNQDFQSTCMTAETILKPLIKVSVGNSLFTNVGQVIDGPQNGPAPPPWSIPAQPNQIFTPQAVNIEVPHTASVKVKTPCYIGGHLYFG